MASTRSASTRLAATARRPGRSNASSRRPAGLSRASRGGVRKVTGPVSGIYKKLGKNHIKAWRNECYPGTACHPKASRRNLALEVNTYLRKSPKSELARRLAAEIHEFIDSPHKAPADRNIERDFAADGMDPREALRARGVMRNTINVLMAKLSIVPFSQWMIWLIQMVESSIEFSLRKRYITNTKGKYKFAIKMLKYLRQILSAGQAREEAARDGNSVMVDASSEKIYKISGRMAKRTSLAASSAYSELRDVSKTFAGHLANMRLPDGTLNMPAVRRCLATVVAALVALGVIVLPVGRWTARKLGNARSAISSRVGLGSRWGVQKNPASGRLGWSSRALGIAKKESQYALRLAVRKGQNAAMRFFRG